MDFQDLFATADIGQRNNNLTVEAAGTLQCRIQYVGTVGCGNDDNGMIAFKAVHFDQKLVQGLFAFVVATAQAGTTLTADSIDFVNENDTRGVFLRLFKHIAHAACTDADEHFNKVGA